MKDKQCIENIHFYFIGLPADKAEEFNKVIGSLTVTVDGQKITLSRQVQGDTVFTLGVEFEEKMPTGHTLKVSILQTHMHKNTIQQLKKL